MCEPLLTHRNETTMASKLGSRGTKARCGGSSVGEPVCGPDGDRRRWHGTGEPVAPMETAGFWPREGEPQAAEHCEWARFPVRGRSRQIRTPRETVTYGSKRAGSLPPLTCVLKGSDDDDVEDRRHDPCCASDGGRSSGVAVQAEIPNHRRLRRSRAGVVSAAGDVSLLAGQVCDEKTNMCEPLLTHRNETTMASKPGSVGGPGTKARHGGPSVGELPVCGPGGARCIGGVSSSQALASERRGRAVHGRVEVNPSGEEPTDRPRQKNAGLWEPYDGRRTVLREREGEVPSRHSPCVLKGSDDDDVEDRRHDPCPIETADVFGRERENRKQRTLRVGEYRCGAQGRTGP